MTATRLAQMSVLVVVVVSYQPTFNPIKRSMDVSKHVVTQSNVDFKELTGFEVYSSWT